MTAAPPAPGLSTVHIPPRFVPGLLRPEVVSWVGGSAVRLQHGKGDGLVVGGLRGEVGGFSAASRRRLLHWMATVNMSAAGLPLFVTLTFPGSWSKSRLDWAPSASKRLLEAWRKRVQRLWPSSWMLWRIEPQKRGAPHFHVLIWAANLTNDWVSRSWWEVVGSGEESHLKAGTNLQRVRTVRGSVWYCAKYVAKVQDVCDGWERIGRWWGVQGRSNVPRQRQVWALDDAEWLRMRRAIVRLRSGPGASAPGGLIRGPKPARVGALAFCAPETVTKLLEFYGANRILDGERRSSFGGQVSIADHEGRRSLALLAD